jgi:hypothetical protein
MLEDRHKHRIYDKKYNYMNYKVLIGNIDTNEFENWTAHQMWIEPDKVDYKCEPHWSNIYRCCNVVVMDYLRIEDKNNTSIYEDDILSSNLGTSIIRYCEGYRSRVK